jgi:hypothetical protein
MEAHVATPLSRMPFIKHQPKEHITLAGERGFEPLIG